ncbi:hypothetical protein HYV81_05880 [Candidatus Woesearchaeota archaeon]|nr:hypothetical protein [Candidatus Woesearchaeota archaeon]
MAKSIDIEQKTDSAVLNIVLDTLKRNKQALVFAGTKRSAEKAAEDIAKKMKPAEELEELALRALRALAKPTKQCEKLAFCLKKGIAFHHAGLHSKQREIIEEHFKNGVIRIVCSTPTLAYGLDLPAYRSIIKDLKRYGSRGLNWIPVMDYHQMAGRAGRPSYDTEGQAITIAGSEAEKDFIFEKYVNGKPEHIYSKLAVEPVLRTYLLSLIATKLVKDKQQIMDFFSKTFWSHQFKDLEHLEIIITKMLELLEEYEFIKVSGGEEQAGMQKLKGLKDEFVSANEISNTQESYAATFLGKRVSELYLDPVSAYHIIEGLRNASGRKLRSIGLLQLLSNTLEMYPLLTVRVKEREKIEQELMRNEHFLLEKEPSLYDPDYDDYIKSFKTALFFESWIDEKDEEFLLEEFTVRPGETRSKLQIADWLLFCTEELAKILQFKEMVRETAKLRLRMQHGVKEELLPLIRLEGIGRVRARVMYNNKIRDLGDIRKADIATLNALLGRKVAESVRKQVGTEVERIPEGKRKGQINIADFDEFGDE